MLRLHGSVLLLAIALGACRASTARPATTTAAAPAHPRRGEGAMRPVRPSAMGDRLKEAGLDPANLPPIETLDRKTKLKVMKTFTESLGVACVDCHAGLDFAADTERKRIAKRMWNEITRVVAMSTPDGVTGPGKPMYCDSCHQGDMFILDRRDDKKLIAFMMDVFDQLTRTDGQTHGCWTCHGDPMDPPFLNRWRASAAPDIAVVK